VCAQHPQALLVLVPRHPERFNEVAKLVQQQGFALARRSETTQPDKHAQVYLGDTMGELMQLYGFAEVAWVGGSFVETGGHNLLEPALWGLPVLSGPSLFNFALISELLNEAGALKIVASAQQLADEVNALLASPARQKEMGSAAQQVVAAHGGALQRVLSLLSARWPSTS
jgi:3-deoxy-D-manno-octulosonic-acid transferase